jgi:CheY-like chemotaxis protein
MKVVEADGRISKAGGRVVKNVTGYDLQKLYTGSLGTLAIIGEISLKLRAKFARTATAIARFADFEAAAACAAAVRKSQLQPVSCEWVGPANEIWLRFGEHPRAVDWQLRHLPPQAEWTLLEGPDEAAAWAPLGPGRYVHVTVSDTGHGMDATTRAHIFEPFFTTKAVGRGTGLGLAMVYGIVTQAGGTLRVESAPGAGATFSILLPAVGLSADAAADADPGALPRGRGTVLIVEDESAVRVTTRRVLERQGYAVLEARHGADALLVWREHRRHFVACITDLRMPEMGGRELAALLRADEPSLPVVYVSGYDEDADTVAGPRDTFVGKPFTAEALIAALQAVVPAPTEESDARG